MSANSWKDKLSGAIEPGLEREIDVFETQIERKKAGEGMADNLFIENRLRRGVYGQRYDNGQRYDGARTQTIAFPSGDLNKGTHTLWDAPGMLRIKIPFGALTADQLDVMAELAEEYTDSILHITTRQDVQLHFMHIEDSPDIMRRLGAVGITTREACGNSVRNVVACPTSGVCPGEAFDVSPYARGMADYLLGHPDVQDFGRKFKASLSGCAGEACGLVYFHDLGAIARTRPLAGDPDGQVERGFTVVVGGGLGAVPQRAATLYEFAPESELLPISQAVSRVFARLGERNNRSRARIKFLVKKLGIDEFRRLVEQERATLRTDPRWTGFLDDLGVTDERPLRPGGELPAGPHPEGFDAWLETNVKPQRQEGYAVATVTLPLGDFSSEQSRSLADIARRFTGDTLRATMEQNLVYRWVSLTDLPALYQALCEIGLGAAGASTITDITSCPGTDTCKLGISASRGLAAALTERFSAEADQFDPAVKRFHIKTSGCFNSCSQHHVADIGYLGVSRNVKGRRVPHFQVVLGGQWTENAGSFGLAIGAVPSKRVPDSVKVITDHYVAHRLEDESFQAFAARIGRKELKALLKPLMDVPDYEDDQSFYSDWGDPREYSIGDIGVGECAGELVPFVQFGLQAAEREIFEAQCSLDEGKAEAAAKGAYRAMLNAASALTRYTEAQVTEDPADIVAQFKTHLHDTELFHDPYAKGKFAGYLFRIHDGQEFAGASVDAARAIIEEAQLFYEAAHACYDRLAATKAAAAAKSASA